MNLEDNPIVKGNMSLEYLAYVLLGYFIPLISLFQTGHLHFSSRRNYGFFILIIPSTISLFFIRKVAIYSDRIEVYFPFRLSGETFRISDLEGWEISRGTLRGFGYMESIKTNFNYGIRFSLHSRFITNFDKMREFLYGIRSPDIDIQEIT